MQIEQIDRDAAEEEAYELGRRDGWSEAVQHIDCLTGGDGEYYASTIPGRGCETPAQMVAGIAERFAALSTRPDSDMVERVARAIYDELEGPVNNQDYGRQMRQWELAQSLARAAIAAITGEGA